MTRTRRVASPAEVLLCGNAGIRKDLGALSRSSGLPYENGLESLFSLIPRRRILVERARSGPLHVGAGSAKQLNSGKSG